MGFIELVVAVAIGIALAPLAALLIYGFVRYVLPVVLVLAVVGAVVAGASYFGDAARDLLPAAGLILLAGLFIFWLVSAIREGRLRAGAGVLAIPLIVWGVVEMLRALPFLPEEDRVIVPVVFAAMVGILVGTAVLICKAARDWVNWFRQGGPRRASARYSATIDAIATGKTSATTIEVNWRDQSQRFPDYDPAYEFVAELRAQGEKQVTVRRAD